MEGADGQQGNGEDHLEDREEGAGKTRRALLTVNRFRLEPLNL